MIAKKVVRKETVIVLCGLSWWSFLGEEEEEDCRSWLLLLIVEKKVTPHRVVAY